MCDRRLGQLETVSSHKIAVSCWWNLCYAAHIDPLINSQSTQYRKDKLTWLLRESHFRAHPAKSHSQVTTTNFGTMAPLIVISSNPNEGLSYPRFMDAGEACLRISSVDECDVNIASTQLFDPQHHQEHAVPAQPQLRHCPLTLTAPTTQKINRVIETGVGVQQQRQRRRVHFASEVQIETVPRLSALPKSEIEARWLTPSESKRIEEICRTTVRMMMAGQVIPKDDDDYCTRGLEIRTKLGARRRYQKRDAARRALLRAQHFQQREGFIDEQYLAELYQGYTTTCGNEAYRRGLSDQQEVPL